MIITLVITTIIVSIVINIALDMAMKKSRESKLKKERSEALDIGLNLDFTDEAKSLKRVEVQQPKARILAVDDEEIILTSFRKILVLAGYSVDTVEKGAEALGLVKKNDYDFVFTDLKMPDMDGLDVTKGVNHLRPDIDIIMITGYATIQSAVDAMKFGAIDHVEKPFTEDELVDFVNKSLIRRQDRIEKQIKPTVRLVTPTSGSSSSKHEFNVPAGVFISPAHSWVSVELNGMVRIGIDDFTQKIIGEIDKIELPKPGTQVQKGDEIFSILQGTRSISIPSPITGIIRTVNSKLYNFVELLKVKPYEFGWVACIEPNDLLAELQSLKIGAEAISWYQSEVDKYCEMIKKYGGDQTDKTKNKENAHFENIELNDEAWEEFIEEFLHL